jgi:propanol-preferring alcohol dehydrogenase
MVRQISRGVGADLVLDFVGAQATLHLAGRLVAVDGDLTIIGSAGGTLTAGKTSGLPVACRVSAPFWGTCSELNEVIALAARGLIRPEVEVFGLSDALTAYQRLESGAVTGRAVVIPD